jgi:tRNA 5-methylaminomethyl-2-thiouridine biosynthesis bifunctional protein
VARVLAERGYAVTVLERGNVANGASGNGAGVLFPQITKQWGGPSDWYFTAYSYALRQLRHWHNQGLQFEHAQCGMLRLPRHADEERLLQHMHETHGLDASIVHWLARDAASAQAGVDLQTGAAYFPEGMWLNPAQLCRALLQHENIELREQTAVQSLARVGAAWQVTLADGPSIHAEQCCITAAHESAILLGEYGITLGAVGGQVSEFSSQNVAAYLRSILCHKGYVIPLTQQCVASHGAAHAAGGSPQGLGGERPPPINVYLVGATYHRDDMHAVTNPRHDENRAAFAAIMPGIPTLECVGGRSSARATTPDRLPYAGAVDDGLYVSTGHGSRGLLSAPLAAEMIASAIGGEAAPVRRALARLVDPRRFIKA